MTKRFFKNRAAWRAWLAANHAAKNDLWLIFYKKASRKKGMSYEEALEEALCFGWIDSRKTRGKRVQLFDEIRIYFERN